MHADGLPAQPTRIPHKKCVLFPILRKIGSATQAGDNPPPLINGDLFGEWPKLRSCCLTNGRFWDGGTVGFWDPARPHSACCKTRAKTLCFRMDTDDEF